MYAIEPLTIEGSEQETGRGLGQRSTWRCRSVICVARKNTGADCKAAAANPRWVFVASSCCCKDGAAIQAAATTAPRASALFCNHAPQQRCTPLLLCVLAYGAILHDEVTEYKLHCTSAADPAAEAAAKWLAARSVHPTAPTTLGIQSSSNPGMPNVKRNTAKSTSS